jgi:hypothetical protein
MKETRNTVIGDVTGSDHRVNSVGAVIRPENAPACSAHREVLSEAVQSEKRLRAR